MKKVLIVTLVLVLLLTACSGGAKPADTPSQPTDTNDQTNETNVEPTEGGVEYDEEQVYSKLYSGEISGINYLTTASTEEFALAANCIDTLVDYDRYGNLIPCLAADWSKSDDGLVWTFNLRKGVKWVTYEGEEYAELNAQDFVDSLKYILNQDNGSKTANIAYRVLKNAEAYYNKEITDFNEVGVKAIDQYTLEYTLEKPIPYFESMLTYVCFFPVNGEFLAEAGDRFGTSNDTLLFNGAYVLEAFEPQNKRILVKNETYWDKENVYIEELKYKYNKESASLSSELYLRGQISYVEIPSSSIDAWMQDPELKEKVRPSTSSFYTYFYTLNFDPQFDEEYEPENWKIAVNNKNFRKSIFQGFDRIAALTTTEPYNPKNKISNTITPKDFVSLNGKDFTQIGKLKEIVDTDSFNEDLALEYKQKAMDELNGKATFPIKVMLPYSTGTSENGQKAQIIEQQLERTLGTDYVDVIIVAFPPSGFLNATRRAGNYAFQEVNWGPDYADPETYTDMFVVGSTYNFPELTEEVDENGNNKFDVYIEMVNNAKAELVDLEKRYELFSDAEAYLIDEAWVIPYRLGGSGYVSSKINPFEGSFSPFGVSGERFKGQRVMKESMNTEKFFEEKAKRDNERSKTMK